MQRPILLDSKPKQMKYHRYENVKLIQRKEEKNTIIQGEHCIFVLEEMESFVWNLCNGENSIEDIINEILNLEDYKNNKKEEIKKVVVDFINSLIEAEIIEV